MTSTATKSKQVTATSEKVKHAPAYYALLAKVGQRKKEASQFQDEAEFYCGIATELLALSVAAVEVLQYLGDRLPEVTETSNIATSELHRLVRIIHDYWPPNTESQARQLNLLESDPLQRVQGTTADGYISLSSELILQNVERAIAATTEPLQKTSSS